ncbi:hypothetical protein RKE25_12400 [Dyella sp. BiH032]|uniref:terpene synthase family protein n=1 Tax=Dyella sp. BiH032 TaxID=3075430 RepID=UPI0028937B1E|nr:hypothetical protein [Dyella sp. BiH032]WNL44228.1 hypothetical protein RKE25_12400 [Dyella sp. BiH032]
MRSNTLFLPLPYAINIHMHAAERQSVAWMERFGLFPHDAQRQRLIGSGVARKAAHMLPCAAEQPLRWASDLCLWGAAFDEEVCAEHAFARHPGELIDAMSVLLRCIEAPQVTVAASHRYAKAIWDLRLRLNGFARPAQIEHWVAQVRRWLMCEVWRVGNLARKKAPSLNDYLVMRMHSGGPAAIVAIISAAGRYEVTALRHADPRVQILEEMVALLLGIDTEFAEAERMERSSGSEDSLVEVMRREYRCDLPQANHQALLLRDQVMSLFLRLSDQLGQGPSKVLQRYAGDLALALRGSAEWALGTGQAPAPEAAHWSDVPRDAGRLAPPIPAIAWWWRYDPARRPPFGTPTASARTTRPPPSQTHTALRLPREPDRVRAPVETAP